MFFINSLMKLLETIYEYAEKELYDEQSIRKKLVELQVLYELGQVSESEYELREAQLLEQLKMAVEYNRSLKEEDDDEIDEDTEEDQYEQLPEDEDEEDEYNG